MPRSRLANAIATAGDLDGLLVAMKDRESRLVQLGQQRQAVEAQVARSDMGDVDEVRRDLQALAADWRGLLGQQSVHARTILMKLVVGRVTFTPGTNAKQWELRGRGTIAGLFQAVFPLGLASPTGVDTLWSGRTTRSRSSTCAPASMTRSSPTARPPSTRRPDTLCGGCHPAIVGALKSRVGGRLRTDPFFV